MILSRGIKRAMRRPSEGHGVILLSTESFCFVDCFLAMAELMRNSRPAMAEAVLCREFAAMATSHALYRGRGRRREG